MHPGPPGPELSPTPPALAFKASQLLHQLGGDGYNQTAETMEAWGPSWHARLKQTLNRIEDLYNPDWNEWELQTWLETHQRLAPATVGKYLRHLRFMAEYRPMPVAVHGSLEELVQTFYGYFRYRETVDDDAGHGSLINDVKTIKTLGAYLGIPEGIWPKAPAAPRRNDRWLPRPEDVWHVLHTQYAPNAARNPENALAVYIAASCFFFGLRGPSELGELRVDDLDLSDGTLVVTEPKKTYSRRTVYIEPTWFVSHPARLSLRNWVECWRPKLEPQTDQLFPSPDGSEWPSKYQLGKWVKQTLQDHHDWWTFRLCRHWCATARLIEWDYDHHRVAEWLGHEKADRVRNRYARSARVFEKRYGNAWNLRAFQRRCNAETPRSASPMRSPPGENDGTGRTRTGDLSIFSRAFSH